MDELSVIMIFIVTSDGGSVHVMDRSDIRHDD